MPKANSDTTEVPKRAPRRRVPRKTVRAISEPESKVEVAAPTVRRKSPTVFTVQEKTRGRKKITTYIPIGVFLLSGVIAVVIGISDKGQINIQELIANQPLATETSQNENGTTDTTMTIPVQNNLSTEPGGGLLPSADQSLPIPTPVENIEPATSTASTTASSTEITEENETSTESEGDQVTNSEGAEAVSENAVSTEGSGEVSQ